MQRDLVIVACAVSAGIHGALVPGHFSEGVGLGAGFVAATALLAGSAAAITLRPASEVALAAAGLVFAGLLASYAVATTVGLPLLHPDPEPADSLALATKAVEAAGLLAAGSLLWRPTVATANQRLKGTLT